MQQAPLISAATTKAAAFVTPYGTSIHASISTSTGAPWGIQTSTAIAPAVGLPADAAQDTAATFAQHLAMAGDAGAGDEPALVALQHPSAALIEAAAFQPALEAGPPVLLDLGVNTQVPAQPLPLHATLNDDLGHSALGLRAALAPANPANPHISLGFGWLNAAPARAPGAQLPLLDLSAPHDTVNDDQTPVDSEAVGAPDNTRWGTPSSAQTSAPFTAQAQTGAPQLLHAQAQALGAFAPVQATAAVGASLPGFEFLQSARLAQAPAALLASRAPTAQLESISTPPSLAWAQAPSVAVGGTQARLAGQLDQAAHATTATMQTAPLGLRAAEPSIAPLELLDLTSPEKSSGHADAPASPDPFFAPSALPTPGPVWAAPVSQVRLANELGSPAFEQELAAQIVWRSQEGLSQSVLHLNPAQLGPVHLQVQIQGSAVSVLMAAEQGQTRLALEQSLPQLQAQLIQAGFEWGGGAVLNQGAGVLEPSALGAGLWGERSAPYPTQPLDQPNPQGAASSNGAGANPNPQQEQPQHPPLHGQPANTRPSAHPLSADDYAGAGSANAQAQSPAGWQRRQGLVDLVA